MTDRADLSRLLLVIADAFGPVAADVIRQAARQLTEDERTISVLEERLREPPDHAQGDPGRCAGCGTPIEQPWTGRRRRWCGDGRCAAA